MDLTGAPYKYLKFDNEEIKSKIVDGSLWQMLIDYDQKGYLMTCSAPGKDTYTESGTRPHGGF